MARMEVPCRLSCVDEIHKQQRSSKYCFDSVNTPSFAA